MAPWLRVRLPIQEKRAPPLIQEDPAGRAVEERTCGPQLLSLCSRPWEPQPLKPEGSRACARRQEKHQNEQPELPARGEPPLTEARAEPGQQ